MFFLDKIREKIKARKLSAFERSGVLRSFSYSFGTMAEGMTTFLIEERVADGLSTLVMVYQKLSMKDGKEIRSTFTLPLVMAQKLKALLKGEELYLWNGYNKSNSVIATGRSFSLRAGFDNYSLKADGMVMMPPGYDEKHEQLKNFLEGLVKSFYTEISEF